MPEEASIQQLILLYEPEAAALTTCGQANVTVEAGERFLILDAGGRAGGAGLGAGAAGCQGLGGREGRTGR